MPEPKPAAGSRRLFLALPVPPAVVAQLAGLVPAAPGLRPVPPAQMHLTLRFLGPVPQETIGPLQERLANVRVGPFLLAPEGLGVFPPHGPPAVCWIGVGRGHPRLFQLRQRIDDAVLAAGLTPDLRTFIPHITLARAVPGAAAAVRAVLRRGGDFAGATFQVTAFQLFESRLAPGGAEHTVLATYPLGA